MSFFKNKNLTVVLTLFAALTTGCENTKGEDLTPIDTSTITETVIEIKAPEDEYLYSTPFKATVINSIEEKKNIDTIPRNTRVLVLEREGEEEILPKVKKEITPVVNEEDEGFTITETEPEDIVKEETPTKEEKTPDRWVHIKYRRNLKDIDGWILEKNLTDDPLTNLPKSWKGLETSNFPEKVSYPDNPKIDVRGIYVSDYSASSEKKLDSLIKLAKETKINAFVIDVKDDFGDLLWKMDDSILEYNPKAFKKTYIKDINAFIKKLKDNNIYLIARIVSFKDPSYAKQNPDKAIIERKTGKPFMNSDGVIWVSPHDKNLWKYNVAVAKEAAKVGFNEVQFDYVRFPASNGGKLDKFLDYRNTENDSKPVTIQKYLKYAWNELTPLHVYINADIYGQIGTFKDDMGLGQYWEALSGYVHYLSPMMYPSHYARGAYGIMVPDASPYKVIRYTTLDSINRNENIDNPAEIRPWLQDFTARWIKGHIKYTEEEVRDQVRALEDLGINQYLLWSASNRYHVNKRITNTI